MFAVALVIAGRTVSAATPLIFQPLGPTRWRLSIPMQK
jgi:hypothetical protein